MNSFMTIVSHDIRPLLGSLFLPLTLAKVMQSMKHVVRCCEVKESKHNKEMGGKHFIVANAPSCTINAKDAADVSQDIEVIGGLNASRLWKKVRDSKDLTLRLSTFYF